MNVYDIRFVVWSDVKSYASTQWYEMTYEQEQIYQHDHLCCNFDSIDPCCRWAIGEGECENEYMCFDRVKPHLRAQFKIIGNCAILQTVILAIIMALALGLVIAVQIKIFVDDQDGDLPLVKSIRMHTKGRGEKRQHIVQTSEFDLADEDYFR